MKTAYDPRLKLLPAPTYDKRLAQLHADMATQLKVFLPPLRKCLQAAHTSQQLVACTQGNGRKPLGHSLYGITIGNWRRHFPAMLIVRNEDLAQAPELLLRKVEEYLGLPSIEWDPNTLRRHYNPSACTVGRKAAKRANMCAHHARNSTHLDLATDVERARPRWWGQLEHFFGLPGHQLAGFEYLPATYGGAPITRNH